MKIVTACYELYREVGLGHYRATEAAYIKALRMLPNDHSIEYIVYTDERTYELFKPQIDTVLDVKNIKLKFFDLNQSEFKQKVTAIKEQLFVANHDYYKQVDKHSCVNNYVELMLEKFRFVQNNITENDEQVYWLDVGLFLNSCNFPWRGWIGDNCNKMIFFDKLEKLTQDTFLLFQSTYMPHGQHKHLLDEIYPEREHLNRVISGGLWGGNADKTKQLCEEFAQHGHALLDKGTLISDQECLTLSIMKDASRFKILEFDDWYGYQQVFLEILGVYNPETYNKDLCNLDNI